MTVLLFRASLNLLVEERSVPIEASCYKEKSLKLYSLEFSNRLHSTEAKPHPNQAKKKIFCLGV